MGAIDWAAVKTRHPLAVVAARTGLEVPATGTVMACCPMPDHDDTHPSMRLDLDRGFYRCFGCDRHGDVIQWVADLEGVKAADAVAVLDSGRTLVGALGDRRSRSSRPVIEREKPDLRRTPTDRVAAANKAAWDYYTYQPLHERGVGYLTDRSIDVAALEAEVGRPAIGHTPSSRTRIDGLVTRLAAKGFSYDELVDAGLAVRHPDGSVIDFFRDRAILPVTDRTGRTVGLVGRDVTDHSAVKYLNQPRTHTYDKSTTLCRPSMPFLDAQANVVVCEGPLDALAIAAQAASAGCTRLFAPVAACGRTLSESQIDQILAIHDRAPVFAADGDNPGRQANLDWAAKALMQGRESVVVDWPDGEDPASWLAEHGDDGLRAITRRGCLTAAPDELRPRHCGTGLTAAALDRLSLSPDGNRALRFDGVIDEMTTTCDRLGPKASQRYAVAAAEVLAPVAVNVAFECGTDRKQVTDLIEQVAAYAAKLPIAGHKGFADRAALAIESRDLAAAGWAGRQLKGAIAALGARDSVDRMTRETACPNLSSADPGLARGRSGYEWSPMG